MSAESVTYVDSSAIVKLVAEETESGALRSALRGVRPLVSSALARTEVTRAVLPLGTAAVSRAGEVLVRFDLIRVNDDVLSRAGAILPPALRPLDAIHLATASLLEESLRCFVCYDHRLADAAASRGWTVEAPS